MRIVAGALLAFTLASPLLGKEQTSVSLEGPWRFQLDRQEAGMTERWFDRALEQTIQLPGALQNQGFGDEVTVNTKWTGEVGVDRWLNGPQYEPYRQSGNIKIPFFLQPEKHYLGAAWYQRSIDVPADWTAKRVVLTLERAHWQTRVWLDGKEAGMRDSLGTPHQYDLGTGLAPGKHTLSIRVDNRVLVDIGAWSHSVSDHTQGNWNGFIGGLTLAATSPVWVDDVQAFPLVKEKAVRVKVRVGNSTGRPGRGTLTIGSIAVPVTWEKEGGSIEQQIWLNQKVRTWDEFHPELQTLELHLQGPDADDRRSITFGLREITTRGKEFLLNGHPVFFRGTLECCIFPLTGYPPTDVDSWKRVLRVCKAYGLNHMRFHSWCPPEAAFRAADELGFYFQVECGVWTKPGETKEVGDWIYAESERIVRAYGNHPSFVLLTHGNEPHGKNREQFLAGWVNFWKQRDPRRLVTSGSAYPQLPENQYHVYYPCRGPHGWLGKDYLKDVEALEVPVIVHEMGQWCVYPRFDEMKKYRGPLKPKNFEIFRDSLAQHGMMDQWRDFVRASGKLQALCYKEEIEAALRTPGIRGFQLLDLHDFPGQGTALVGVLDAFWESKGYISAREYREFCNTTVPLARVLKRTWTTGETFSADVELAHFGPTPLEGVLPRWRILDAKGMVRARGELRFVPNTLPLGSGTPLGHIAFDLVSMRAPQACRLVVDVGGFQNSWNFWVYPGEARLESQASGAQAVEKTAPDVLVARQLDQPTLAQLQAGAKVFLQVPKLSYQHPRLTFEPIFWNRYMFNTQSRQTLGLLCQARHPALAQFPTESFQDWQWAEIVTQARGMVLDSLPRELHPIVQPIDDWNTNRKLGLIWECRVGKGKLLVCSADLHADLDKRPAARQLRASLLEYISSPAFKPKVVVEPEALVALFARAQPSKVARLGAKIIEVDSEDTANGNLANHVLDGDPETIWHTQWQPSAPPMPHYLVVDLGAELELKGLACLPRQNMSSGRIAEYEVFCSNEPKTWSTPAASGKWPNSEQLQTIIFKSPVRGRYLKLVAKSEVNRNPFASLAELDIIADGK